MGGETRKHGSEALVRRTPEREKLAVARVGGHVWLVPHVRCPPATCLLDRRDQTGAEPGEDRSARHGPARVRCVRERHTERVAQDLPKQRALAAAVGGDDLAKTHPVVLEDLLAIDEAEGDAFE